MGVQLWSAFCVAPQEQAGENRVTTGPPKLERRHWGDEGHLETFIL